MPSPFTQPLTASMVIRKEKQAQEKAHPPGTSKILAKARKKAMEEEKKVNLLANSLNTLLTWKIATTKYQFSCCESIKFLYYLK